VIKTSTPGRPASGENFPKRVGGSYFSWTSTMNSFFLKKRFFLLSIVHGALRFFAQVRNVEIQIVVLNMLNHSPIKHKLTNLDITYNTSDQMIL
jgi:hypothetical protein